MTESRIGLATAVLLLATTASSQSWFTHAREHRHVPVDHVYATSVAAGDLDGDGDLDLVIARDSGRALRDDGGGRFTDSTSSTLPTGTDAWSSIALLDIDADGDLDLFAGTDEAEDRGSTDRIFVNDGLGHFTDETIARIPNADERTSAVVVGDVDGDGDLDVIAGAVQKYASRQGVHYHGTSRLYLNDGAGNFTDATVGRLAIPPAPGLGDLALADLDADGILDLVVAHDGGLLLFSGRAGAVFVDVTASALPTLPGTVTSAAAGDVDGDLDVDLVIGCSSTQGEPNLLLLNDGAAHFAFAPAGALPADAALTRDVALGDTDADGDLDLLVGNASDYESSNPPDQLYENDGTGRFTNQPLSPVTVQTSAVLFADLDGDGDTDACSVGRGSGTRLFFGDGAGAFLDAARPMLPATALAIADFDSDGDVDVVGRPDFGDGTNVWINDGRGIFDIAASVATGGTVADAAVADLDADGYLDVAVAIGLGYRNSVLYGNGAGSFQRRSLPGNATTTCVAFGDVDGDGDFDLVFGNDYGSTGQQNQLYLNGGGRTFTEAVGALPAAIDETQDIALGDVDADGDLDLVAANKFDQSTLALNDGAGRFVDQTATHLPQARLPSNALVLEDLDGDGDLDLVLGNDGQDSKLYLNDGTGHFTDVGPGFLPTGMSSVNALVCADLDQDGDLDLGVGSGYPPGPLLLENDGSAHFVDRSADAPALTIQPKYIVAHDLDDDGDIDLALGGADGYGVGEVLLNRLRSLEAPWVPNLGGELRLEVHASVGRATVARVALPLLGFVRATPPLAIPGFGTLRIDPATAVPLPGMTFYAAQSPAVIRMTVPLDVQLLGGELFAQALVADMTPPARMNLTALVAVRIWR